MLKGKLRERKRRKKMMMMIDKWVYANESNRKIGKT